MDMEYENFYFNNKYINDLNLYVAEPPALPIPCRSVELVEIENRSGAYVLDNKKYKPLTLPIKLKLIDYDTFMESIMRITNWLNVIEDNKLYIFYKNTYYKVLKVEYDNIQEEIQYWGQFEITFYLDPFRYEKEKVVDATNMNKFLCTSTYFSEPKLDIKASGNIQININGETVKVENVKQGVIIDTQDMTCLAYDGSDKEFDMTGDFPILKPGNNTFSFTNVSNVKMTLRNRYL